MCAVWVDPATNLVWTAGRWGLIKRYNGTAWTEFLADPVTMVFSMPSRAAPVTTSGPRVNMAGACTGMGPGGQWYQARLPPLSSASPSARRTMSGSTAKARPCCTGIAVPSSADSADAPSCTASGGRPKTIYGPWGGGAIYHYDGRAWLPVVSPTTKNLWGIWGSAGGDLWIAGEQTVLHKKPGQKWQEEAALPKQPGEYTAIWGADPEHLWVGLRSGAVLSWNGSSWGASEHRAHGRHLRGQRLGWR